MTQQTSTHYCEILTVKFYNGKMTSRKFANCRFYWSAFEHRLVIKYGNVKNEGTLEIPQERVYSLEYTGGF